VDEITEQQIGVYVFGKPASYNPSDDTIVRATARQLRQRLAVYYQEAGREEWMRITIPKGGYVPVFNATEEDLPQPVMPLYLPGPVIVARPHTVSEPPPLSIGHAGGPLDGRDEAESAAASAPKQHRPYRFALGMAAGLAIAGALFGAGRLLAHRDQPSDRLWQEIFSANQQTVIVNGDAGLNLFENLARHEVTLDEYSSHSYMESLFAKTPAGYTWDPFVTRTYTSIQNSRLSALLLNLPESRQGLTKLGFARSLTMQELKDSNVIMLGAPQYDPWEHLFEGNLNFTVHYDGEANTITVLNKKPRAGESPAYTWSPANPKHGYALITLTGNLSNSGHVLLVQGTTAASDDAASDFLTSHGMDTEISGLINPSGGLHNFQLLLETSTSGGDSTASRVIARRILP
jgi:hypothetical protein